MEQTLVHLGITWTIKQSQTETSITKDLTSTKGYKEVWRLNYIWDQELQQQSDVSYSYVKVDKEGVNIPQTYIKNAIVNIIKGDEYNAFYGLGLPPNLLKRAGLNGILSIITGSNPNGKVEDGIKVFDQNASFIWTQPIDWDATKTNETSESANDGSISAIINDSFVGNAEEFKVTRASDNVVIQDWSTNLTVTGLVPGDYIVEIRQTDDFGEGVATAYGIIKTVTIDVFVS